MNYIDQFFIIKDRLFETKNIVLLIIMTIIFMILFSCLTIIKFSIENQKEIYSSEIGRTYIVYTTDEQEKKVNEIKNIEHVEFFGSGKYRAESHFRIEEFDKNGTESTISVKPITTINDVEIKKGRNIENKYEMICSDTFYPYDYDNRLDKSLFISSNKLLNKEVKVKSKNEDLNEKEITLTIVGTYKNKFMEESTYCRVNMDTFYDIASKYSGRGESHFADGTIEAQYYGYENYYVLRIDNKTNIEKVLTTLDNMNIEYEQAFYLDEGFIAILFFIPLFTGIIVILITISILYSFINKKINNRIHNFGILKSIGYEDKTITSININENILIIIISSLISFVLYLNILNYLKYTLLAEVTYGNYILNVPFISIILLLIILIFIIIKIIKSKLNKILKLSIQDLLEK